MGDIDSEISIRLSSNVSNEIWGGFIIYGLDKSDAWFSNDNKAT